MDAFDAYESGLTQLLGCLDREGPSYLEALGFQARLLENMTQARDFGDSENLRSERNRVLLQLNQLTLETLGISFNELCGVGDAEEFSEVRKHYFERLERYFKQWSERYTDLRLTTDIRVATYKGIRIRTQSERGKWWFRDALGDSDERGRLLREQIVILGDPGGGKTTACQRAVWELAREGLEAGDDDASPVVPVYLELSAYRANDPQFGGLAPYQRMLSLLAQEITRLFAGESVSFQIDWQQLENYIRLSNFAFFLDGLNEVGLNHRTGLIEDIRDFIDTFKGYGHQFIITTRKFDYEYDLAPLLPTDRFELLEILELDSAGVNEFVMRDLGGITQAYQLANMLPDEQRTTAIKALDVLKTGDVTIGNREPLSEFRAVLKSSPVVDRSDWEDIVTSLEDAQQLLGQLRNPQYARVLWLSQNPATLKDVIDVYRDQKNIPQSRMRLFKQAVQARLRAEEKKLRREPLEFSEEMKFEALQAIAVQMIEPGEGLRINRKQLMEIFDATLQKHDYDAQHSKLLLRELVFDDGLLVEKTQEEYSFIKQPYQEYFVAQELRDRWISALQEGKDPVQDGRLQRYLENPIHFQVAAGMAGLLTAEQAENLIGRLRKHRRSWRLAAICVRNSEELPTESTDDFINWTRQRILRFAFLPDSLANLIIIFLITVFFAVYISVDPSVITTSMARFISALIPSQFCPILHWIVGLCTIGAAFGAWYAVRRTSPSRRARLWRWFDIGLLVVAVGMQLPFLLCDWAGYEEGELLLFLSFSAVSILLLRLFTVAAEPTANRANVRFEEYVVNTRLLPYLEILRDMGPNANSTMIEIKEELARNKNMSDRIKDAIERTWTLSPRTVLQVIEEVDVPARQAETVKVLEPVILRSETDSATREQAVRALVHIIEQSANVGAVSAAVTALGKLAVENPQYRSRVILLLEKIATSAEQPEGVRRKAWKALNDLGIQETTRPPLSRVKSLLVMGAAAVVISFLLITLITILVPIPPITVGQPPIATVEIAEPATIAESNEPPALIPVDEGISLLGVLNCTVR